MAFVLGIAFILKTELSLFGFAVPVLLALAVLQVIILQHKHPSSYLISPRQSLIGLSLL